jgi:hypothetical protein
MRSHIYLVLKQRGERAVGKRFGVKVCAEPPPQEVARDNLLGLVFQPAELTWPVHEDGRNLGICVEGCVDIAYVPRVLASSPVIPFVLGEHLGEPGTRGRRIKHPDPEPFFLAADETSCSTLV